MADKNILKLYDKSKNVMTPGIADMPEGMKKRIYGVGELESLNTDYKGDLVGAVNEINDKLSSTGSSIPGPQNIKVGDMDEGYFGAVTGEELITGDELTSILGVTQGDPQNSDTHWHKFGYGGKILFIAQKTIRHSISWDHLNEKGVVYGDKIIEIGGVKYKVRLVKGALTDPSDYSASDRGAKGSEWNRLVAPLSIQRKNNNWDYPDYMENDLQDWETYLSDSELTVRDVDGRRTWCQEVGGDGSAYRVYRGFSGVSTSGTYTSSFTSPNYGWRPVLEVVDNTDTKWGKDELELGGRNYLTQKDQEKMARYNDFITTESKQENGLYTHEIVILTDVIVRAAIPVYDYKHFKEDDDITVSCDIKSTEELLVKLTQTTEDEYKVVKPNEWVRVSSKVDYGDRIGIYTAKNRAKEGAVINVKNYKLEKGNVATPFSLAPEDLDEIATQTSPLANLDHIRVVNNKFNLLDDLYKDILILNTKVETGNVGYPLNGIVRHYDYNIQKKLMEQGYQDSDKWYDLVSGVDGEINGEAEALYKDDGLLINREGSNKSSLVVSGLTQTMETQEYSISFNFIPYYNTPIETIIISNGFPSNTYLRSYSNEFRYAVNGIKAPYTPVVNKAVNLCFTSDKNSNFKGYINGVLVSSGKRSSSDNVSTQRLTVGVGDNGSILLNNIKIYDRVLSDLEVVQNAISLNMYNYNDTSNEIKELREMIALRGLSR